MDFPDCLTDNPADTDDTEQTTQSRSHLPLNAWTLVCSTKFSCSRLFERLLAGSGDYPAEKIWPSSAPGVGRRPTVMDDIQGFWKAGSKIG